MSNQLIGVFDATGGKAVGSYDVVSPGSSSALKIPKYAVIRKVLVAVKTTFTSAGSDAGTIQLKTEQGPHDIVAAVAISDAGNPWDAGLHDTIQDGDIANSLSLQAGGKVKAVVAGQALTAGKLILVIEYDVLPIYFL